VQNTPPDRPPAYLIESVDAALQIVVLIKQRGELRVSEAAAELGIARSTAHRLLRTLVWRNFLTQDRVGKAYRAGPVLVELTMETLKAASLRTVTRPRLEQLSAQLDATVSLLIREGGNARFLDQVEGSRPIPGRAPAGSLLPATTVSGGKVLLAWLPEAERRALYPGRLPKLTPHTTTDHEALAVEFAEVRRKGYALNVDGSFLGLSALAVPIRGADGKVIASLAASTRTDQFAEYPLERVLEPMLAAAASIGLDLESAAVSGTVRAANS